MVCAIELLVAFNVQQYSPSFGLVPSHAVQTESTPACIKTSRHRHIRETVRTQILSVPLYFTQPGSVPSKKVGRYPR